MTQGKKPFATSLGPSAQALSGDFPRVSAFRPNSVAEAVANKLVQSPIPTRANDRTAAAPAGMLINTIANKTAANVNDAENMMQLLPDLELAKQVLISSILSPNDMMSTELAFNSTADDLGEIKGALLKELSGFFKDTYKIETQMPRMLEEILFRSGAFPIAVLPESSIDDAINSNSRVSQEVFNSEFVSTHGGVQPRHYGVLGNSTAFNSDGVLNRMTFGGIEFGLEKLSSSQGDYNYDGRVANYPLYVTDNINLLKYPMIREKMREDRIQDAYAVRGIAMEARRDKMGEEADASLYRPRSFLFNPVLTIKTLSQLDKPTVGHPMTMNLPTESIIPIHVPSSPSEHVGYFIVQDRYGSPVRVAQTHDYFADLNLQATSIREMSGQLLAQTRRASEGRKPANEFLVEQAVQMYTEVIEADLKSRLQNGLLGEEVTISKPTEIYRVMFARACQGMLTQLVFVPTSLMTYMAFDYNDFGVGRSLVEATKILGSIRAMLLFANTMSAIKNSVNHVELGIELDPADPDPDRTVEFMVHEFAKTRMAAYPIGAANPLDIINYLQNAGIQVTTSGHPGYPETKVSIEDKGANRVKVDTELSDELMRRHLMALGMAPETVEMSMNVDFAAQVISSNVLLAKRAMLYQQQFCAFLSDHITKYTVNSQILMDKLRKIIEDNREQVPILKNPKLGVDKVILYFLSTIELSLPKPDLSQLEMQQTAFENYSKALDTVLPAWVSSEMFDSSIMGELGQSVQTTVAILKAYYQRKWLQNNNVMPELFELVTLSENEGEGFDLLQQHEAYMKGLSSSLKDFMTNALQNMARNDKYLNKIKELTGAEDSGGDTGGGEDTGGGDEGGGDGMDDMFGDTGDEEGEGTGDTGEDTGGEDTGAADEGEAAGGEEEPAPEEDTAKDEGEDKEEK